MRRKFVSQKVLNNLLLRSLLLSIDVLGVAVPVDQ